MQNPKITVFYSCHLCGLNKVGVEVDARDKEDVIQWMDYVGIRLSQDHKRRSPLCVPKELKDVMIPMTGVNKIGGAPVQ